MATDTRATACLSGAARLIDEGAGGVLDHRVAAPGTRESFDAVVLPHLHAGYRLARWLMRNEDEADDVLQEASLRALRYFRTFGGGDGRAWFLRIVRNTCYGWRRAGAGAQIDSFDEEQHSRVQPQLDPETLLLRTDDAAALARALSSLPDRFHRLLVLREVEGLSYRELSEVIGIPVGTVMSRLSRARDALRGALYDALTEHPATDLPPARTNRPTASGIKGRLAESCVMAPGHGWRRHSPPHEAGAEDIPEAIIEENA